jgi:fatty-acyl-CoA synthase
MGVPDERFGPIVAALVQRGRDGEPDACAVVAAARQSLAGYKVPRLVIFVDQVPRAPNGKIDYPAARALLARSSTGTELA